MADMVTPHAFTLLLCFVTRAQPERSKRCSAGNIRGTHQRVRRFLQNHQRIDALEFIGVRCARGCVLVRVGARVGPAVSRASEDPVGT
jgi:hypothetical protein